MKQFFIFWKYFAQDSYNHIVLGTQKTKKIPPNNEFNPFQLNVPFYIETSHLICSTHQMTGSYMKCNTRLECGKHNIPQQLRSANLERKSVTLSWQNFFKMLILMLKKMWAYQSVKHHPLNRYYTLFLWYYPCY